MIQSTQMLLASLFAFILCLIAGLIGVNGIKFWIPFYKKNTFIEDSVLRSETEVGEKS